MRWWAAALVLLAASTAAFAKKATNAALRKAFENNRRSVVEVVGKSRTGGGVVVGQHGEVLTSVDYVTLESATVRVDGVQWPGTVVMASAELKAAMVVVDAGVALHPPAVRLEETFVEGTELVAIERDAKEGVRPRLCAVYKGRKATSPFVEVNAPLANGTPLFDTQGRLVAISVERRASTARALPIPEVKVQLQRAQAP